MLRVDLVLWIKQECGACREAEEMMASLSAALDFDWHVREGAYAEQVPVVATAGGAVLAEAPIAPAALARAIRDAQAASSPDRRSD